jgi:hypothetical protein
MVLAVETFAPEAAMAWERESWVRVLSGGKKCCNASLFSRGGRRPCPEDRPSRE